MLNKTPMVMQLTSDHFRYFHSALSSNKLVSILLISLLGRFFPMDL